MSLETGHFYEFKNFRLDTAERVLLRDGKPVSLTPKAYHLLKIWADSFVEEGNLTVSAMMLRKALADDVAAPTFIETVPRRGYRFVADVKENFEDVAPKAQLNGSLPAATPVTRAKRFVPIAAISLFILGSIVITAWYARSEFLASETSAPILSAPFNASKFYSSGDIRIAISSDGKYAAFLHRTTFITISRSHRTVSTFTSFENRKKDTQTLLCIA